jgi:glycosyltransferase involved in cell wall biosynthesis
MRILHAIISMDPAGGGPPIMAARLAAAQASLGCQTRIVSYQYPAAQRRIAAALQGIPGIAGVKLDDLPPPSPMERLFASGVGHLVQPMLADVDLVHLHGVWDPLIYAVSRLAAKAGKPYVLTPHGMLDPWSLSQKRLKKRIALVFGYRRMLNGAAFLHFLNSDERDLTRDLQLTVRSLIIPNGIFLEELDPLPARGKFREVHREFADAKIVLFLSRLHYKKGLDYLADAMAIVVKDFPDARLVVAGPDDGARAPFEHQTAKLGIADRVHLVGPLYGEEKIAALRDCDCFCLPSRQEGFSLAVTEAMACQAPVVISTECHFPEVRQAGAGIIAKLKASDIAEGIKTILHDADAAKQMGLAGRELVISRFTWPKVAQQMIEGYEQAIQDRK